MVYEPPARRPFPGGLVALAVVAIGAIPVIYALCALVWAIDGAVRP